MTIDRVRRLLFALLKMPRTTDDGSVLPGICDKVVYLRETGLIDMNEQSAMLRLVHAARVDGIFDCNQGDYPYFWPIYDYQARKRNLRKLLIKVAADPGWVQRLGIVSLEQKDG